MLTSVPILQYSLQALAVRLGLTEYFPSAVHRQTRLGAILSPLVRTTTTNHSPVLSITALYLLQVRALEIATDKSTINLKFLHPGSDPDSGHSSMTSAANSVFTSPLKKVRYNRVYAINVNLKCVVLLYSFQAKINGDRSPQKKVSKSLAGSSSYSITKNPSMPELNLL